MLGVVSGLIGAGAGPNPGFGLFFFATWTVIGLVHGGIAWLVEALASWRKPFARLAAGRDAAIEALRERFARGEIDESQFDSMFRRLKDD